jgi:SNF2 family DNA or RNA helicase
MNRDATFAARPDLCIINPEGLGWLEEQDLSDYNCLIVDESSRFKNTGSLRFKILKRMIKRKLFKRRYILTGSPVPNGLMDIFGQMYILDLGHALGEYITHFRLNYFSPDGEMGWKLNPGADKLIYEAIKPLVLRHAAIDHLDLPPLINVPHELALPDDARDVYTEFEKEFLVELEGNAKLEASNSGVLTQKLRQVANGTVYATEDEGTPVVIQGQQYGTLPPERVVRNIHGVKLDALNDIISECQGSPVMVAYEFNHDRDRILDYYARDPLRAPIPWIGGGVPMERQGEILADWDRGVSPIVLVQCASAAHGLNLQAGPGHILIWYSITWDWEVTDQLIKRLHRQGQKQRVLVHWLLARDTVDEIVFSTLGAKDRTQRALLDAVKRQAEQHIAKA